MKKFLIFLIFFSIPQISIAEIYEANLDFNWVTRSQNQRNTDIINIKDIISSDNNLPDSFSRKVFKENFRPFLKDMKAKKHYEQALNKVKETENFMLAGFFKGKLLIMYGIQYKNDLKHTYYYDVYGNLRYVDILSSNYPAFPYYSKQYKRNGKCIGIIYFLSKDTQFVYTPNYEFKGLWQAYQMYDKNAKKLITRSNY